MRDCEKLQVKTFYQVLLFVSSVAFSPNKNELQVNSFPLLNSFGDEELVLKVTSLALFLPNWQ